VTLLRISNIADFLTSERNIDNAIQFIALNACPSGEVSRIYLARLNGDMSLQHYSSFGFRSDFLMKNNQYSLLDIEKLQSAVTEKSLGFYASESEARGKKSNELVGDDSSKWKTTIYIPLLPNYAAALSTQIVVEDTEEARNYFGALRSVLSLYIHLLETHRGEDSRKKGSARQIKVGDKLTERQTLILDLIKQSFTNNSIADRLGYSESLIRQETIAIYAKLGVDGRRDLTNPREFE
jgi:DNA-binding CsgD family transcriptional regulator